MQDRDRYGSVELDLDDKITKFSEKSTTPDQHQGLISAGTYLMCTSILNEIQNREYCSLEEEKLPSLLGEDIFGYVCSNPFIDIGTPESFHSASEFFKLNLSDKY